MTTDWAKIMCGLEDAEQVDLLKMLADELPSERMAAMVRAWAHTLAPCGYDHRIFFWTTGEGLGRVPYYVFYRLAPKKVVYSTYADYETAYDAWADLFRVLFEGD